jgi:hypothetical protein
VGFTSVFPSNLPNYSPLNLCTRVEFVVDEFNSFLLPALTKTATLNRHGFYFEFKAVQYFREDISTLIVEGEESRIKAVPLVLCLHVASR